MGIPLDLPQYIGDNNGRSSVGAQLPKARRMYLGLRGGLLFPMLQSVRVSCTPFIPWR